MANWSIAAVQHTAINATNFERSLTFYRDTLGLTLVWENESSGERLAKLTNLPKPRTRVAMVTTGSHNLEIFEYLSPPPENRVARPCDVGVTHIAFVVDNVQKAYEELSTKGVQFNCPPQYVEGGPMQGWTATYFRDPDGITLELMQPPG